MQPHTDWLDAHSWCRESCHGPVSIIILDPDYNVTIKLTFDPCDPSGFEESENWRESGLPEAYRPNPEDSRFMAQALAESLLP